MESTFFALGSKSNFNKALNHFYTVTDIVDDIESKKNIADIINDAIDQDELYEDQKLPIVGAVLKDKFNYSYSSFAIPNNVSEFDKIIDETSKWTGVDIVFVYYDANSKVNLINPKNQDHWERVRELYHDQLLVIYTKYLKDDDKEVEIHHLFYNLNS